MPGSKQVAIVGHRGARNLWPENSLDGFRRTRALGIDGAGPLRFFRSILLPLSVPNMVALAIILFLYGWNQYLWPLLFTTDKNMATAVIGLKDLIPQSDSEPAWNVAMNAALLVMLPPAIVVMALQRWLVRGLVDAGK